MIENPKLLVDQVLAMIDAAIRQHQDENPIATARRQCFMHLRDVIAVQGLNLSERQKRDYCLMPLIFQELNYDGFDWGSRQATLGHLEDIVNVDVVVWSGGLRRSELTDTQYRHYCEFCRQVMDDRS